MINSQQTAVSQSEGATNHFRMGNKHSSATTVHVHPPPSFDHGHTAVEVSAGKDSHRYYALGDNDVPYSIQLVNDTTESYFFAVYQDFPLSPGLESLAWQVR